MHLCLCWLARGLDACRLARLALATRDNRPGLYPNRTEWTHLQNTEGTQDVSNILRSYVLHRHARKAGLSRNQRCTYLCDEYSQAAQMCRTCYASRSEVLTWSEGSTFLSLAAVKSRLALVISMTSKAVAHIISPPNGECVNVAQ